MLSAMDISRYFLSLQDVEESGDSISNLKLQKLLYYAQGLFLAYFGKPLFSEEILAWEHGPVVPDVYHMFKEKGSCPILPESDFDIKIFDDDTREFLNEVYDVYGQFSAWKLRSLTHEEPPWKEASVNFNGSISHDALKKYFKTQLIDDQS